MSRLTGAVQTLCGMTTACMRPPVENLSIRWAEPFKLRASRGSMKRAAIAIALLLVLPLSAGAWGEKGHLLINRVVFKIMKLPAPVHFSHGGSSEVRSSATLTFPA
jgi:hypothetical protein